MNHLPSPTVQHDVPGPNLIPDDDSNNNDYHDLNETIIFISVINFGSELAKRVQSLCHINSVRPHIVANWYRNI